MHKMSDEDIVRLNTLLIIMMDGIDKIEAINAYSELTGVTDNEAKEIVDKYWIDRRMQSV